jgi:predicted dehydrogenase
MGIRVGIIGVGKMGLSHFSIVNAMKDTAVVAICDTSRYVLSVLSKYVGVETFTSPEEMMDRAGLDAVFVATPSSTHFDCARYALDKGLHLVEKPSPCRLRRARRCRQWPSSARR